MRLARALIVAALLLSRFSMGAAQEADLGRWVDASDKKFGGLAVLIDPANAEEIHSVTVSDDFGKQLAETKWDFASPFFQKYVLPAGKYQVMLPGQGEPVDLEIRVGKQLFVQAIGTEAPVVSEEPTSAVLATYDLLAQKGYGDLAGPTFLNYGTDKLLFLTKPKPPPSTTTDDPGPMVRDPNQRQGMDDLQ